MDRNEWRKRIARAIDHGGIFAPDDVIAVFSSTLNPAADLVSTPAVERLRDAFGLAVLSDKPLVAWALLARLDGYRRARVAA